MGWHTPDEYFEHHVLADGSYEEAVAELAAAQARLAALSDAERSALTERGKHDHSSRYDRILLAHGYEATLAFLDQAQERRLTRLAAAAAARAAQPPTVGLAERAVWVVMQLSENYGDLKRRQDQDADAGPAQVFRGGFDPSITFTEARLDLSADMIDALVAMRAELAADGFFTACRDRQLEEDSQLLIDKLRDRLDKSTQPAPA